MASKKILFIDDEKDFLKVIKSNVELKGTKVKSFSDPQRALSKCCSERFDIICTDIRMPGVDILDYVSSIRESSENEDTPIVLVSSYLTFKVAEDLAKYKNIHYREKPIKFEEFNHFLDELLDF